jgi:hypothetical protein
MARLDFHFYNAQDMFYGLKFQNIAKEIYKKVVKVSMMREVMKLCMLCSYMAP